MNEDPILKLKMHLEKHWDREQAYFSIAGLRALLINYQLLASERDEANVWRNHYRFEVERLTKQTEALQTQFGAMRERTVAAEAEIERHLKDKSDWATKWEAEHNSTLDQQARVAKFTAEVERLKGELEIARAVAPHFYHPSTMHMGDCSVCGNTQDAPQHQIKAEVERLRGYEQTHIENLNAVREKLLLSDVTLQFVSVALGGPDEWSTHETMISSVRRTAEAAKAEIEQLKKERDELIVEKSQSSWGEFQRQGKMMQEALRDKASAEDRANKLEAQVKRLLAKESERIGESLVKPV